MACVMAVSADATFSGTVLLCPFSLEQPHDIADGMYVQVSAAPLTGCLAVYAEVPDRCPYSTIALQLLVAACVQHTTKMISSVAVHGSALLGATATQHTNF